MAQYLNNLFRFAFAKQAMIHVNTGKLITDCLDEQRSHNGRVNAAGKGQKNFAAAHLVTNQFYLIGNEVFHVPVAFGPAGVKNERSNRLFALWAFGSQGRTTFVVDRPDRKAGFIYGRGGVDRHAVDDPIDAAIQNNTFNVRKSRQLRLGNIVRMDLCVYA